MTPSETLASAAEVDTRFHQPQTATYMWRSLPHPYAQLTCKGVGSQLQCLVARFGEQPVFCCFGCRCWCSFCHCPCITCVCCYCCFCMQSLGYNRLYSHVAGYMLLFLFELLVPTHYPSGFAGGYPQPASCPAAILLPVGVCCSMLPPTMTYWSRLVPWSLQRSLLGVSLRLLLRLLLLLLERLLLLLLGLLLMLMVFCVLFFSVPGAFVAATCLSSDC